MSTGAPCRALPSVFGYKVTFDKAFSIRLGSFCKLPVCIPCRWCYYIVCI